MKALLLSLATLVLLPVSDAKAQDSDGDTVADPEGGNVRYRKKTEIDFEDVSVDGELKKPQGALVLDKRQTTFNPLIRPREDFNQEMVESVNQIR